MLYFMNGANESTKWSFLWGELTCPCNMAQKIPKFIRKMTKLQIILERTLKVTDKRLRGQPLQGATLL
jgi:hypothetical protein